MPTISQLPSATAATDSDEILISQSGITRKLTRTQLLAGMQTALTPTAGTLLGRSSKTTGSPETIAIGDNLVMSGGTLSAAGGGFSVASQPAGLVPSTSDLIAVSQDGKNVSVTYRQLLSGLTSVPNIDISQTVIVPTGSATSSRLADVIATSVPRR